MNIPAEALQKVLDLLDAELTVIALDAGSPTEAGLENEHYRAPVTAPFRDANTSVYEIYLDETQGNGQTGGIAILYDATEVAGTGSIFALDQVDVTKSDRDSLTISVELTVEVAT